MSSPRTPEDGRRAENIKQYYQQLCANYRMVSQQLQHPDLPPTRRPVLQAQLEKLQTALQEFTDKVIKPIISANKSSPRGSVGGTPVQKVKPGPMISAPATPRETPNGMAMGKLPKSGAMLSQSTQQFLDQTRPNDGVLVEVGPTARSRASGTQTGVSGSIRLSDVLPDVKLTREVEDVLLTVADRYLANVCQGICESARHRKRPGISTRDFELVISRELGMTTTTAGIPFAVGPVVPLKKKSTATNPHSTRLQQLKKHLANLPQS
ncbi:Transcription initiation factor TFIID subunit 12 [Paramicrosporidium saccamoebae]|uniref:Transcription initiation factor TFIID subunit 12 n=1 Tax=Paramicrosporidium saccamoebae TaxID=1246581 RepID=A0A2H9TJU8_9FUNG|nr:Transcription initiation factor TFIID subunit 12 [Paramicrosporidium saccamoebae]